MPFSSSNLDELLKVVAKEEFVLFIGAGANGKAAPKWKDMLDSLLETALRAGGQLIAKPILEKLHKDMDIAAQGLLVKELLGPAYETLVKQEIYKNIGALTVFSEYMRSGLETSEELDSKFGLLRELARLSQNKRLRAILTLNYDDLLEMSIESLETIDRKPVSFAAGASSEPATRPDTIPIFHLHGILPLQKRRVHEQDKCGIVLAQDEYLETMMELSATQTCTPVHYLSRYCVIFVGLSMTDWNLLRLLDLAKRKGKPPRHFCISRADNNLFFNRARASLWRAFGVNAIFPGNDFADVRNAICLINQAQTKS